MIIFMRMREKKKAGGDTIAGRLRVFLARVLYGCCIGWGDGCIATSCATLFFFLDKMNE